DEQVDPLIYIKSTGGSSAANLLNRFCYLDKSIESATKRIIEKEDILAGKDAIIAEIIHLPESRMGNVILRPSLRKYEIPYLASASVGQHFTIPVTDLMVSVSGDKHINLRSKSLNKKIIPRLSTALNFTLSNLSIYSFLCQLQSDGVRNNISFQWGNYLSRNAFRPRVVYKNSILYAATWKLDSTQISGLRSKKPYELMMAVQQFRADSGLPEKVVLVNGDNKLLIDFSVHDSVELLLTEVKEKDFYLEEFLYDPEFPLITSDGHTYRNEVIINFYKSDKNVS
ncbi:MAG TPA: lantibiotic dehydratase, partial [Chitinophagaceae bacterium]|nr:lantibiotic dehydratase [Chitinophagaceae bacterium]